MRRKHPSAFTLVELLVVIAVIAVLIAMIIPGLGEARWLATRTRCSAQLHTAGRGMVLYAIDYKGKFPSYFLTSVNLQTSFILDPKVGTSWADNYGLPLKTLVCPTLDSSLPRWGFNSTVVPTCFYPGYSLAIPALSDLTKTPIAISGSPTVVPSAAKDLNDKPTKVLGADINLRPSTGWSAASPWNEVLSHRRASLDRPEGGHSLFLDGHVQWFIASKMGPAGLGIDTAQGNFDYAFSLGRHTFWGVLP